MFAYPNVCMFSPEDLLSFKTPDVYAMVVFLHILVYKKGMLDQTCSHFIVSKLFYCRKKNL